MKLLDLDGYKIVVSFYNENFHTELQRVKSLYFTNFNPVNKRWEIPRTHWRQTIAAFPDYVKSQKLLEFIKLKEQGINPDKNDEQMISKMLENTAIDKKFSSGLLLRNHQIEGVKWLLNWKSAILCDDMGLGKTITALVTAKCYQSLYSDVKIIVICPVSLRKNWEIEAEKVGVNVITYSWGKFPESVEGKYLLLVDEAHYAQSPSSQRTKKLTKLSKEAIACYLLTGTPMKNGRPINMYSLLAILGHPVAENKKEYSIKYCNGHIKEYGRKRVWDESGASNLQELARLTSDRILRRMKSEVLDLPPKLRIIQQIESDNKTKKLCNDEITAVMDDFLSRAEKGEVSGDAQALVQLGAIRRINSKYKVEHTVEMVQELIEQNQQVVVFAEFKETVELISSQLIESGISTVVLTGETKDRQKVVDDFQSGKAKVFVGTIKAGGVGLTLTRASQVILVDRPWTPGDVEQAEDRCYRIGQTQSVFCYWLQWGEVDIGIDQLLQQKQANISIVLRGKASSIKASNVLDFAQQIIGAYKK